MNLRSIGIVCLGLLFTAPSWAQELSGQEPCPHKEGWRPTDEELRRILSDHKDWLEWKYDYAFREVMSGRRADLCNADLGDLDLNGAYLPAAKLNNGSLVRANLNNAIMLGAQLNNANLNGARLNNADLSEAKMNKASLMDAKLDNANLTWAKLNNATMIKASLNNTIMIRAELNNADLTEAKLNNADLRRAKLNNSNLTAAEINSANMLEANLNNANLSGTKLNNTNLTRAEMSNTKLIAAELKDAKIANLVLTNAAYAPASAPPDSYVAGIKGLSSVTFPVGQEIGLVQLRDLLQKAGLRDLEREATFAIERGKTISLFDNWRENPPGVVDGAFRHVAFGLTVAYGLLPGRALVIIGVLWVVLIPIYAWPIWRSKPPSNASSIYRVWPKDRVEVREDQPTLDYPARVERLHGHGLVGFLWAAYFSLLSTFQIGFREFSVGTWLTRAQPRNFVLESTGWIRTVSGLQSLLSVYLLAIWLVTYFGRPFQ